MRPRAWCVRACAPVWCVRARVPAHAACACNCCGARVSYLVCSFGWHFATGAAGCTELHEPFTRPQPPRSAFRRFVRRGTSEGVCVLYGLRSAPGSLACLLASASVGPVVFVAAPKVAPAKIFSATFREPDGGLKQLCFVCMHGRMHALQHQLQRTTERRTIVGLRRCVVRHPPRHLSLIHI